MSVVFALLGLATTVSVALVAIVMVAVRFVAALWFIAPDGLPPATARAIRRAEARNAADLRAVLPSRTRHL